MRAISPRMREFPAGPPLVYKVAEFPDHPARGGSAVVARWGVSGACQRKAPVRASTLQDPSRIKARETGNSPRMGTCESPSVQEAKTTLNLLHGNGFRNMYKSL